MTQIICAKLQNFLADYHRRNTVLTDLYQQLNQLIAEQEYQSTDKFLPLYDRVYPELEKMLWSCSDFDGLLEIYQALFREQESIIQQSGEDDRYEFILSIPIADRPEHLRNCLESIYQLCLLYGYGGQYNGVFNKIRVIVAEDSKHQINIDRDIELAEHYSNKGLQVIHFGLAEQYALLQQLPESSRQQLGSILTSQPADEFFLKGQAANRNLSYLKFLQLSHNQQRTLYYLVDSDQSFLVNRLSGTKEVFVAALNYFYYINRIFSHTDTLMLTGKLVGDPPVSPSVMAANFLDDVIAFLQKMSDYNPQDACQFHQQPEQIPGDAAYHDMAKLFGFENESSSFEYLCRLTGAHNNRDCLNDFCSRLNDFFYGEHLTRKTGFKYDGNFDALSPARTIYPGNYIVNYAGLKYIIPFGDLRFRMSGPTAGRLIQAELGPRFASANLPMLHRRTTEDEAVSDFRPGVEQQSECIDLADEFERQFFGDLMLFSVIELLKQCSVVKPFEKEPVTQSVDKIENELLKLYQSKHAAVVQKNAQLFTMLQDADSWLQHDVAASSILGFINNIDLNFGKQSKAYHQQILSASHRQQRKQQIINALLDYRRQRDSWDQLF